MPAQRFPLPSSNAPIDPSAASAYRDYQRQRQMTLGDLLLENRIILLQGEIYDGNANELVMKLLYLQSENRRKDIHFYINSPGGSVTATMAIYDTMQILSCPVATYCVGLAASGGAVLLAGGASGKRFSLPHAKVMIHQPYGQVGGQVSDIWYIGTCVHLSVTTIQNIRLAIEVRHFNYLTTASFIFSMLAWFVLIIFFAYVPALAFMLSSSEVSLKNNDFEFKYIFT